MNGNDALSQVAGALSGGINRLVDVAVAALTGWKTFYLPAEYFINVFNWAIGAGGGVLNNQALDLRLPYDFYIYALASSSTGDYTFLLKASGGGVFFGNAQALASSLFSVAEPVLWLRRPFKLAAQASLSVDLTDVSGAANAGQLNLIGWKAESQFAG